MGCIQGLSFSSSVPGRKPISRPTGTVGRATIEAAKFAVHDGALQAGGHGQQGFAGAGLAHEGDELDAVVEQGVEGEVLLAVAGLDAPDAFAAIQDGNEFGGGLVHLGQGGALGIGFLGQGAEFVGEIICRGR